MTSALPDCSGAGGLGYASRCYARSFEELGPVEQMPALTGVSLLSRALPDEHFDFTGLYPFTVCADWSGLREQLESLQDSGCLSVVLVTDPFASGIADLDGWGLHRRFKTHWVVDLQKDWRARRTKNTRYYTRRALREHELALASGAASDSEEFWSCYEHTVKQHQIEGVQRMSPRMIRGQFQVPGSVVTMATHRGRLVGAVCGYLQGEHGFLHLLGLAPVSRRLGTSYALIHCLLETLEERGARFVDLGGCAGLSDEHTDGLCFFKRRWATDEFATYLLGDIFDRRAYDLVMRNLAPGQGQFFPAYRRPGSPYEWTPWKQGDRADPVTDGLRRLS